MKTLQQARCHTNNTIMSLRLENITLADRAVLSDIIVRANFDDPYGQTYLAIIPSSPPKHRI